MMMQGLRRAWERERETFFSAACTSPARIMKKVTYFLSSFFIVFAHHTLSPSFNPSACAVGSSYNMNPLLSSACTFYITSSAPYSSSSSPLFLCPLPTLIHVLPLVLPCWFPFFKNNNTPPIKMCATHSALILTRLYSFIERQSCEFQGHYFGNFWLCRVSWHAMWPLVFLWDFGQTWCHFLHYLKNTVNKSN